MIVHAFERDAVRIRAGTTAQVTLAALPGQRFFGKIKFVGRQVDMESRTIPIRIEVANTGETLRPGMSASAWIPLGGTTAQNVITVPAASLQRLGEDWVVFRPAGEGVFQIRKVGRGRDIDGEVEILSGLSSGQTIVVQGAFLLKAEAEKARGEGERHEH